MGRKRSMTPRTPQSAQIGLRMMQSMQVAGLSVPEVAQKMGRSTATVYKWTAGRSLPPPDAMEEFSKLVGQPVSYFYVDPEAEAAAQFSERMVIVLNQVLTAIAAGAQVGDAVAEAMKPYSDLPTALRDLYNRMTPSVRRVGMDRLTYDDIPEPERQALRDEEIRRQRGRSGGSAGSAFAD